VAVDSNSNVFVAGSDAWWEQDGQPAGYAVTTIKYDTNGRELWVSSFGEFHQPPSVRKGAGFDSHENFILDYSYSFPFDVLDYANNNGNLLWEGYDNGIYGVSYASAWDSLGNTFLSGALSLSDLSSAIDSYGTIKLDTNGSSLWTHIYYGPPVWEGAGAALAVTVDDANNVYTTGYVSEPNAADNNIVTNLVTIKYDNNGNQIWLQQYAPPGNGGTVAVGNAIAVDNTGNVYVTGYESTEAGGTEMILIKYSPIVIQRRMDGTVLLQAQGSPGESFEVKASTNLQTWLDLGSVTADTNGLVQFDDTNAPAFNSRFYLTVPQ
jgi:hypothetical protein